MLWRRRQKKKYYFLFLSPAVDEKCMNHIAKAEQHFQRKIKSFENNHNDNYTLRHTFMVMGNAFNCVIGVVSFKHVCHGLKDKACKINSNHFYMGNLSCAGPMDLGFLFCLSNDQSHPSVTEKT